MVVRQLEGELSLPALEPPVAPLDGNRWHPVPADDPILRYLCDRFGRGPNWEVTRLLGAAYAYRSRPHAQQIVAKFYSAKTRLSAEQYADRERAAMQRARLVLGDAVVEPLDLWRGVLVMPFASGLSLQSAIAVRRNQAGRLSDQLVAIARVLAKLHSATARPELRPDLAPATIYAHEVLESLSRYGVLEGDPLTRNACEDLIARWAEGALMHEFVPAFVHGDATTANFLFSSEDRVVALDWERAHVADPAHDLGRLAAEVAHSIVQQGGDVAEALRLIADLNDAYCASMPKAWSANALRSRARFYWAVSSLRIARNAWSPRWQRTALVAQALALLSSS